MKISVFFVLMASLAVPVFSYQTGPASSAKFGSGQKAGQNNYRTFSNYNDRVQTRGVQTDTVSTQLAGSEAKDLAAEKNRISKKAAAPAAQPQAQAKPAAAKPQQPTAAAANAPDVNPAQIMQQVQGMVDSVGSLSGALQQQGQKGANPMAGMPDISALMNGGAAKPANPAVSAKK